MGMEHTWTADLIAAHCRAQMEAFDALPASLRTFLKTLDISVDALAVSKTLRQYGLKDTMAMVREFTEDYKRKVPIAPIVARSKTNVHR